MAEAVEVVVERGLMQFHSATEEDPCAGYLVAFKISVELREGDFDAPSTFRLAIPVLEPHDDAPYSEVEMRAARLLAPALRSVADRIEKMVDGRECDGAGQTTE